MRTVLLLATLLVTATASAASADVYLKVEGVARPANAGPIYVKTRSSADSDGDGLGDAAVLRLHCEGSRLGAAALRLDVVTAREAGSGLATGRRKKEAAHPVKEWGPSTPQFRELLPRIRISTVPAPSADADGWTTVALAEPDGVCPAADAAARTVINTSRSNIKNN
jgi:hypothetical protein